MLVPAAVRLSIPKPRAISMSPVANLTNLAPSVGAVDNTAPDYIGELTNRITSDIASARNNANVDVTGLVNRIKSQQANWKPNIKPLPPIPVGSVIGRAPTGDPNVRLTGNVDKWIAQAYKILGIPLTPTALAHEKYLINKESGGKTNIVNKWDINAKRGTPSIGIEQVIQPTFNRYMVRGHGNIRNPVDNILASLGYRLGRYHKYDIGYYKGGY